MRCRDSIALPFSCGKVYDLVADFEAYPEFLPGWQYARILHRQGDRLQAEQRLRAGPAEFHFQTIADLEPGSRIQITSNSGPFRELHIDWVFIPLAEDHCRLKIDMSSSMKPGLKNRALQLLLQTGCGELLPLFERRARLLYRSD